MEVLKMYMERPRALKVNYREAMGLNNSLEYEKIALANAETTEEEDADAHYKDVPGYD